MLVASFGERKEILIFWLRLNFRWTAVYLFDRGLLFGQEASYIWRYRLSIVPALTIMLHGATILNFSLLCYEQMVNLDCTVSVQ